MVQKKEVVLIILPFGLRKYTFSYGSKKEDVLVRQPLL